MQRNKVHHVQTVARVAKDPCVDEDLTLTLTLTLTLGLKPEDGVIRVYGIDDEDRVLAFTEEGVEEVQFLLREHRSTSS